MRISIIIENAQSD